MCALSIFVIHLRDTATVCRFYHCAQRHTCHGIAWQMQAFGAVRLHTEGGNKRMIPCLVISANSCFRIYAVKIGTD